jgi:hypothetical protein
MKKLSTNDDVLNLLSASVSSSALSAAIETGLLEMLAEKPMTSEEVSQVMDIPGKRGNYWLQMLKELGILDMNTEGFVPSALARNVILDVEDFRKLRLKQNAVDERERLAGVRNMALYISAPSIWKTQGLIEPEGYVEKMKDDPERAYSFTRLLYSVHQNLGSELADLLDLTGIHNLMDVGGGSGVEAMAIARKYPDLNITTVDIENVCSVGREIVKENNLSDRITFYPADFLVDELPKGFDFVLHCDVGVFGVEQFHKLWVSLKPEGHIAVIFHFPALENFAPLQFLEWAFLDSLKDPDFGFPTVAQVREQLMEAGFQTLPGEHTLSDGRIVIQARKGVSHE